MKNNNTSDITTAAVSAAEALWQDVQGTYTLAETIATLCQASGENYKTAGEAFANAWNAIGGGVDSNLATRRLVEACHNTSIERKSASKFLNGVGLVTKQRISQLLAVVYDGDKSKNNGNVKANKESKDSLDKKESGKGFTFDQIMAALQTLPSITKEQAKSAAALLASKIA